MKSTSEEGGPVASDIEWLTDEKDVKQEARNLKRPVLILFVSVV